eukprot:GHVT01070338.1.p1 GENE.GHVT01070338.1~~GHVT01070338.1.p1  ORF type:complete len:771 (-),score=75.90 GHVT01070338.1:1698-4010(-)
MPVESVLGPRTQRASLDESVNIPAVVEPSTQPGHGVVGGRMPFFSMKRKNDANNGQGLEQSVFLLPNVPGGPPSMTLQPDQGHHELSSQEMTEILLPSTNLYTQALAAEYASSEYTSVPLSGQRQHHKVSTEAYSFPVQTSQKQNQHTDHSHTAHEPRAERHTYWVPCPDSPHGSTQSGSQVPHSVRRAPSPTPNSKIGNGSQRMASVSKQKSDSSGATSESTPHASVTSRSSSNSQGVQSKVRAFPSKQKHVSHSGSSSKVGGKQIHGNSTTQESPGAGVVSSTTPDSNLKPAAGVTTNSNPRRSKQKKDIPANFALASSNGQTDPDTSPSVTNDAQNHSKNVRTSTGGQLRNPSAQPVQVDETKDTGGMTGDQDYGGNDGDQSHKGKGGEDQSLNNNNGGRDHKDNNKGPGQEGEGHKGHTPDARNEGRSHDDDNGRQGHDDDKRGPGHGGDGSHSADTNDGGQDHKDQEHAGSGYHTKPAQQGSQKPDGSQQEPDEKPDGDGNRPPDTNDGSQGHEDQEHAGSQYHTNPAQSGSQKPDESQQEPDENQQRLQKPDGDGNHPPDANDGSQGQVRTGPRYHTRPGQQGSQEPEEKVLDDSQREPASNDENSNPNTVPNAESLDSTVLSQQAKPNADGGRSQQIGSSGKQDPNASLLGATNSGAGASSGDGAAVSAPVNSRNNNREGSASVTKPVSGLAKLTTPLSISMLMVVIATTGILIGGSVRRVSKQSSSNKQHSLAKTSKLLEESPNNKSANVSTNAKFTTRPRL